MRLDIPGREPPRIERQDLVVEPLETPLALTHDLRLERARPVPRGIDRDQAMLGDQHLRGRPVTRVARTPGRLLVRLEAEMVGQLDLQRPLQQPLRQLGKQATRAGDLVLRAGAGQQLVDQPIREKRLDLVGELRASIQRTARSASASLRSPSGLAPLHAAATRIVELSHTACDCRGHESPFDSCLHSSSDNPAASNRW